MKAFHKTVSLGIRMTKEYRAKLRRAAEIEMRKRRLPFGSGELLLELAEPGIDRIIAQAEAEKAA